MCDPQVRFCERPGGESPRAYSTHTTRRRRDRPGGRIVQPGDERRRGQPLQAAMRPPVVVVHPPLVENDPGLRQAQEQLTVEQLVPRSAVEALHVTVLPRACLLDVERAYARPRQPLLDFLGHELWPVVAAQMLGRSPHGEQVLECHDHVPSRERPRHLDRQALPRELVDHHEDPQLPAVLRPLREEVVAPHMISMQSPMPHAPIGTRPR
jgi:hypothetical protein